MPPCWNCITTSFLFPARVYSMVCMSYNVSIHSLFDRQAENTVTIISVQTYAYISFGKYVEVEGLGHRVGHIFVILMNLNLYFFFKISSRHLYLINFNYPCTRTFKIVLQLTDVLLCLFVFIFLSVCFILDSYNCRIFGFSHLFCCKVSLLLIPSSEFLNLL